MKLSSYLNGIFCSYFLLCFVVPVFGAGEKVSATTKPIFNKVLSIGTANLDSADYNFGSISSITVDDAENIYVADAGLFRVQKYSPIGEFLMSFGEGNGTDVGQFLDLKGITLDKENNLYVADFMRGRITVFGTDGNVSRIIKVSMPPYGLVVDENLFLYVIGFPGRFKGPLIHKYDRDGTLIHAFCDRSELSDLILNSGYMGEIAIGTDQNIYYSLPYPYKILKFSPNGELLAEIGRADLEINPPFFQKPQNGNPGFVRVPSASASLSVLSDGKIVSIFGHRVDNQHIAYVDVFSPGGSLLFSERMSQLDPNVEQARIFFLSLSGTFFLDQTVGVSPQVWKYNFYLKDK